MRHPPKYRLVLYTCITNSKTVKYYSLVIIPNLPSKIHTLNIITVASIVFFLRPHMVLHIPCEDSH